MCVKAWAGVVWVKGGQVLASCERGGDRLVYCHLGNVVK